MATAESGGGGGVCFGDDTRKKTAARWANAVSEREGRRDAWCCCWAEKLGRCGTRLTRETGYADGAGTGHGK